ncbi:MAG: methyltransferase domain-containing protein [Anaerolineae bacterium]|nr:methyltransferase domain-containing protein [Anaerolineae bacterium]
MLRPQVGDRLLDVACGEGTLVKFARRKGVMAYGIDLSNIAVRRACQGTSEKSFVVGDGAALPFPDGAFEHVTCIGSLEHYVDPVAGIHELRRVLCTGGRACILLPNTFSLLGNVMYAWRHGDVFDDGQPIQRYHTRWGWQRLLEQNGLRVLRVVKYEMAWPRTWADRWWYLSRPRKIGHLLMGLVIPLHLANCLVYICTRS